MFIAFASLILGIIILISLRDWAHYARRSNKSIQKSLKKASQRISLQDWEGASKELIPLLESSKGGKEAALCEIQLLKGQGMTEEALLKTHAAALTYPEELSFRLEEGVLLAELGLYQEAVEAFKASSSILRTEAEVIAFAEAALKTGNPHLCLDLLQPYLEPTGSGKAEHTRSGKAMALAADAFYELKEFSHAIQGYLHALRAGHASHHTFLHLGHSYRRHGNLAEAEKIFRELNDKDPADIDAVLGIGSCLQERGQYTKAFLVYQTGLSWSRDLRLLQKAAYAALRTKRYAQAESYFFEVTQRLKPDALTLAYYGLSLECQKKWSDAQQIYHKLVEFFPDSHHGYRALAWMFGVGMSQNLTPDQGLHFAQKALQLQNDSTSWEILSACIARTGEFEKAYQIQLSLAKQDRDHTTRNRRQQVLRTLRKKEPLQDQQVLRSLVA